MVSILEKSVLYSHAMICKPNMGCAETLKEATVYREYLKEDEKDDE